MLQKYGPEKVPRAPLAPESLDRGTTCLGIRVWWCVRPLLTGRIVIAVLSMVFDNPPRRHLCLGGILQFAARMYISWA